MSKRVGIWIRVSTEDQKRGDSPEHHEERAKMYAKSREWEVVEVYHLEAVSGKSVMHHHETKRMLYDIERGHIDGLIFSKLARLARNTKELLDFADIFEKKKASLISLQEAIDTSTPAGRLFYTIISAMAQWEREEIADRVSASVAVRAKMGKLLGGPPPYGYAFENKELVINKTEAPIRKLMFELYFEHKRKSTVAKIINERGYRTRRGTKFSDVSITRNLKDPIAKGMRRMNYSLPITKENPSGLKPKEEWVFHPAPAIVSEELWENVNTIIEEQEKKSNQPLNKKLNLFTGYIHCNNGHQMFVQSRTHKYSCKQCKIRITKDDLENVFRSRLTQFVLSEEEISNYLSSSTQFEEHKKSELEITKNNISEIESKMDKVLDLHLQGQIPTNGFKKHYEPLHEQLEQLQVSIPLLDKEIKDMSMAKKSMGKIVTKSKDLYENWNSLSHLEKRDIIEAITNTIIFDGQNLTFKLKQIAPSTILESNINGQQNHSFFD